MKHLFSLIVLVLGTVYTANAQLPSVTLKDINGKTVRTDTLSNGGKPFIIDFFATWCGPCKMLAPVLEDVSTETEAKIYKVDIDESSDLAREYGIMVVPTMIIFVDGKQVEKFSGYMQKNAILDKINAYVK